MQRVTLVRYVAKPDCAEENEDLAHKVFRELQESAPKNITYALFKSGLEFVHLFVNLENDDSDALTGLASFKTYSQDVASRCESPPAVTRLAAELIDSYGFPPVTK